MLYQLSRLIQSSDRESALTISDFAMANLSQDGLTNVLNKMHRGKKIRLLIYIHYHLCKKV